MKYVKELRARLIRVTTVLAIMTTFCMTLSIHIHTLYFGNYKIVLPYVNINPLNNIAIQTIHTMKSNLLPTNVALIQTEPTEALFAEINVALLLGLTLVMPLIIWELIAFVSPALYRYEKKTLKIILVPAITLFAIGCLFSYFYVIPYLLNFLYYYGNSMNISSFFSVQEFAPFVMQFMIAFGLSFQLPIIMWAITASALVEPKFWRDNLKYAVLLFVIFGAVITPDGSGITMWFVAGPMLILYLGGMMISERKNIMSSTIKKPY